MLDFERFTAVMAVHGGMHESITAVGARRFVQALRRNAHFYPCGVRHLSSCFSATCGCGQPKEGEAMYCHRCRAERIAAAAAYTEQCRLEDALVTE